jgi:hypothetical protein
VAETSIEKKRPRVKPTGIICPRDPKRASDDPDDPPTHLALDVLKIDLDERPFKPGEKRRPSTAHLRCQTCGHEFTLSPWPPAPSVAGSPETPR